MKKPVRFLTIAIIGSITLLYGIPGSNFDGIETTSAQVEGILLLNEISPWPSDGAVWIELINPGNETVTLDGWTIEFMSGFSYTFPQGAGEVDPGALHILNISGENPLNQDGDGCTLSSPDHPVDAITWGNPPRNARGLISSGVPLIPLTGIIDEIEGLQQPDDVIMRIPGTWPPDSEHWLGSGNWAYCGSDSSSRGQHSPYPPPAIISPCDGAYVASDIGLMIIGFGWTGELLFQVARDSSFSDVVFEETAEGNQVDADNLDAGTYYWRVSPDSGQTWSPAAQFTRAGYDIDQLIAGSGSAEIKGGQVPPGIVTSVDAVCTASHIIPCSHIQQNKDTTMLCLDGCEMTGYCAWCDTHAAYQAPGGWRYDCEHGRYNCARACLAMVAATGGCTLSQDRISYYAFEESGPGNLNTNAVGHLNDPRGDLSHRGTYKGEIPLILDWIYNYSGSDGAYNDIYVPEIFDDGDRSDMDSIREFIDDDRAVLRHSSNHSTLITGYAIVQEGAHTTINWLLVQNPARQSGDQWYSLESTKAEYRHFTFPPKTGSPSRNDELEIDIDTDGDGVFDFDELRRFGTLPGDVDTDGDGVHDLEDIVGYVFEPDGAWFPVDPDIDSDGARKESDPDNDHLMNDGASDGCEDANHNGFFDSNGLETECFVPSDDFTVTNPDCFFGYIRFYIHTDLCDDTEEEIILREGVMGAGQMVHTFTWEHNMCIGASMFGQTYTDISGHTEGVGSASVELISHEDGRYSIDVSTDPAQVAMPVESNVYGTVTHTSQDIPLFLNQLGLDADRVGFPEQTPDGGLVLRGYWNLMDLTTLYSPSELESMGESVVTDYAQSMADVNGEGYIEWEIWLQAPSH